MTSVLTCWIHVPVVKLHTQSESSSGCQQSFLNRSKQSCVIVQFYTRWYTVHADQVLIWRPLSCLCYIMESDLHSMTQCVSVHLQGSSAHIAWCRHLLLSSVSELSCSNFSCPRFKGHCSISQKLGSRPLRTSLLFILIRLSSWFGDRSSNWHFFCL